MTDFLALDVETDAIKVGMAGFKRDLLIFG